MTAEPVGMMLTGITTLFAGLILVGPRLRAASAVDRLLLLGPVCDAVALAIFGAEHMLAARELAPIVPRWTYFVGACWLLAALSFILWRQVRWSATLTAALLLIIVATIDLPNVPRHLHERLFWTLFVRETSFAAGAMVLAGSVWQRDSWAGVALVRIGRAIVAAVMVFYAIEHFLFPLFVPGVPLEKHMPAWVPAPTVLSYVVGIILLLGGIGLFIRPLIRTAAATAGTMLVLLTVFFYLPILIMEIHTPLVVEGINYVGDTLLFAGTVLLAGLGTNQCSSVPHEVVRLVPAERVFQ
jgi:uncharacterized membrane protein